MKTGCNIRKGTMMKTKLLIAATLLPLFSLSAKENDKAVDDKQVIIALAKHAAPCPTMTYDQLKVIRDKGSNDINGITVLRAMDKDSFAKNIPGALNLQAKKLNFDNGARSFVAGEDGSVSQRCSYLWGTSRPDSAKGVADAVGLKSEGNFQVDMKTPFRITTVTVKNENSKPISVGPFAVGAKDTLHDGVLIAPGSIGKLSFTQANLDPSNPEAVKKFIINGGMTAGSKDVSNCPATPIGGNHHFTYKWQAIGTRCE